MDGIFPPLKQLQNNGLLKTKPDIGLELPVLAEQDQSQLSLLTFHNKH
jgi:hypothetical protein